MLRYLLAGLALKAFSLNDTSQRLYRWVGNTYGARKRAAARDLEILIERGDLFIKLAQKHGALRDGHRMLDIGTGWMHWYSLYAALYYDRLRITALDVWDNRQFGALLSTAEKARALFAERGEEPTVLARLDDILNSRDLEDLYSRVNLTYVIERQGSLAQFADRSFDSVISFHVLEHVSREGVNDLLGHMHRVLEPGGCTVHQIAIADHLTLYDRNASRKQYLKYSDRTWRMLFENKVQYFNRLQASEWESRFAAAQLQLVDRVARTVDVESLRIHPQFRHLPQEDFGCTILTLVHRKNPT
jgi:SAM-dependent methyltransferase